MMRIGILLAQGASIFIAILCVLLFIASGYLPALFTAVWACVLVWWCRELLLTDYYKK